MAKRLILGAKGLAVNELQANLLIAGFPCNKTGVFDAQTDAAVRAFQTSRKLTVDGVVGTNTWQAIHGKPTKASSAPDTHDPFVLQKWLDEASRSRPAVFAPPPSNQSRVMRTVGPFATVQPPRFGVPAALHGLANPPMSPLKLNPVPEIVTGRENRDHHRLLFDGYDGQGWRIINYERYLNYQIRTKDSVIVRPFDPKDPIKNECAQLVQYFGVPSTREWRRGPQVCHLPPNSIPVGTVVATLRDGCYYSDYSGRSHVGIYLGHDSYDDYLAGKNKDAGVWLFEQSNFHPIARGKKKYRVDAERVGSLLPKEEKTDKQRTWKDKAGVVHDHRVSWTSDGEEYFVLMTRA